MQITPGERLMYYAQLLQGTLFGLLEAEMGPLSEAARLLVAALEMVPLSRQLHCARGWLLPNTGSGLCRRGQVRVWSAEHAAIARAVAHGPPITLFVRLNQRTPDPARIDFLAGVRGVRRNRVAAAPARSARPAQRKKDRMIGHITRYSTSLEARERFEGSRKHPSIPKRKRGRPRKGERALSGRRLPHQRRQRLPEMLEKLPCHRSLGVKTSSEGINNIGPHSRAELARAINCPSSFMGAMFVRTLTV